MWGLEDETGEMTCLLTKRSGDDRDRAHEQILEAGLRPTRRRWGLGTFSQTGDIFYVDDLYLPLKQSTERVLEVCRCLPVRHSRWLENLPRGAVAQDGSVFGTDPLAKTIKYLICPVTASAASVFTPDRTVNWPSPTCLPIQ